MNPEQYSRLVGSIKEQISVAHQNKLYHRDLHLRNIMIGPDGQPHLIDFGDAVEAIGAEDEEEIYRQKTVRDGQEVVVVFERDEMVISKLAGVVSKNDLINRPPRA